MGYRKLKNGRYCIIARIRVDKKIRQKRITKKVSCEQAKRLFEELKKELRDTSRSSLTVTTDQSTFKDLLELHRRKSKKAPFSLSYNIQIDRLIKKFGDVPLSIFADRFEKYYDLLRMSVSETTGKPLSNHSINRQVEIVKAAYNTYVDLGKIELNPITKRRFPILKTIPRDIIIHDDDQNRLIEVMKARAPHLIPITRFALQVPCRKDELVNMKKRDLDLINNCIRVRNGTSKNDEGMYKPIPANMINYFRTLPKETEYLFYRVIKGSRKDRAGTGAQYVCLGDFKKAWRSCLKDAELEYLRFHDTRHVSASDMVDSGTPSEVVNTVAGWKTDMLKRYYHRNPKKALQLVKFRKDEGKCEAECEALQANG